MEENKHHIDKLFKDSIEPSTEKPSDNIWNRITAQLDGDDAEKYKRKFIIAKRIASALFLILLLLLVFDYTNNQNKFFSTAKEQTTEIERNHPALSNTNQNRLKTYLPGKNSFSGSGLLGKGGWQNNGKKINKTGASAKRGRAKIIIGGQQTGNIEKTEVAFLFNEVFSKKYINTAIDLDFAQLVLSSYRIHVKSPDTSNHILAVRDELLMPSLVVHHIEKSIKYEHALNFTVYGSAVWARYNLQNDVTNNSFSQNSAQNMTNSRLVDESVISERENPELSFNAGLLIAYNFKKHLGFQTGLVFNSGNIVIQPQKVYASPDASGNIGYKLVTSSGYGFVKPNFSNDPMAGDSLLTTQVQHNLQYVSIPFLLKYNISFNKFTVSPGLGLSVNLLTSSSIQTDLENSVNSESVHISSLQGTQLVHMSIMANAEIKYALNNKWALDLIPALSYAFTPVTRNSVVKTYPYNLSVGIGINYRLN